MKTEQIAINLIDDVFDVRNHTYPDHVEMLTQLRRAGTVLSAIKIYQQDNGRYGILDGRHRLKAAKDLGDKTIESEICTDFGDNGTRVLKAFRCNLGGARPPIPNDYIRVVIELLEEQGWSVRRVCEEEPLMKPYLPAARKAIQERKIKDALKAIASGDKTLKQAAGEYELDISVLRRHAGIGKAEEAKASTADLRTLLRQSVSEYKSSATTLHRRIMNAFRKAEIESEDATAVLLAELKEIEVFTDNVKHTLKILQNELVSA